MTTTPITHNTVATIPNPNDQLAMQVADALVTAGLIKDSHRNELLAKLKDGGVSQEDWNLWVDLATTPQDATGEADNE